MQMDTWGWWWGGWQESSLPLFSRSAWHGECTLNHANCIPIKCGNQNCFLLPWLLVEPVDGKAPRREETPPSGRDPLCRQSPCPG